MNNKVSEIIITQGKEYYMLLMGMKNSLRPILRLSNMHKKIWTDFYDFYENLIYMRGN